MHSDRCWYVHGYMAIHAHAWVRMPSSHAMSAYSGDATAVENVRIPCGELNLRIVHPGVQPIRPVGHVQGRIQECLTDTKRSARKCLEPALVDVLVTALNGR